jgi:phosphoserine phosphatase
MAPEARVLLIHITGHDKPGVTHSLTQILAGSGARVLDIGQAVIHDALALGILVELTDAMRSSPLLTDLLLKAHELGVQVRFSAISEGEYQAWVEAQTKSRFLITVLGRSITAADLAEVSSVVLTAGLNIDRIERLSSRMPLHPEDALPRACIELAASGSNGDEGAMRDQLMRLTEERDVDIAFQHDNMYRRTRRLVVFDMDSTLIQTEVIDELAKLAGVGDQVAKITEAAMRGELDFQGSFRRRVALLKGLPAARAEEVLRRIPLTEGAERLTLILRRLGYKMAILSGGFTFIGRDLQQRLGIDYLHANELEITDGIVTGEIVPPIVDGERKAMLLREIAAANGLALEQVIAVGDGANDLPMLRIAGLGIAFRAKAVVRQSARQAISRLGLDAILYLLGVRDRDIE